jgi:hypothetical protein
MSETVGKPEWRNLRILVVVTLIVMTVQGWTGDTANLFVVTYTTATADSFSTVLQNVSGAGPILVWHAAEGLAVLALSLAVLAMSIRSKPKSIRILSVLGTFMVASAVVGGYLFVASGFQDSAGSAQMGGSFIGAYAFYFMELYYAK